MLEKNDILIIKQLVLVNVMFFVMVLMGFIYSIDNLCMGMGILDLLLCGLIVFEMERRK